VTSHVTSRKTPSCDTLSFAFLVLLGLRLPQVENKTWKIERLATAASWQKSEKSGIFFELRQPQHDKKSGKIERI